ncbi:MAG: sulfatase-like hydrolase/transferase [Rhizobiaceae bacterium]
MRPPAIVYRAPALVAVFAGCLAMLYVVEQQLANMPFVGACVLALALVLFVVSRRPAFSLYGAMALTLVLTAMSVVKYRLKGFDLHVFDLFFTGSDSSALTFLVEEYWHLAVPLIAGAVLAAAIVSWIGWNETPSGPRRIASLAAAPLLTAGIAAAYPLGPDQPRYFHYLGGFDASAFFVSLLDMELVFGSSEIAERVGAMDAQPAFAADDPCGSGAGRPDVFVVLEESQTDPAVFRRPELAAPFAGAFTAEDGKAHSLVVETFGGGTWLSSMSVMTGLSTADFGAQAPYLTVLLEGHVRGALPALLAACGYRTVAITPTEHGFVNEGPFLESIGFQTVLDSVAIGATRHVHRDSFYFDAAERFIAEHRRTDGRPLFVAIETMFPHSPYGERLSAAYEGSLPTLSDDPEIDEYLRRVLVSRTDLAAFLDARRANPTDRGTVVLDYGDHQSFVTKPWADALAGGNALVDLESEAYRTYYAFHAYGYETRSGLLQSGSVDIGFLAPRFLDWARLPMSPVFRSLLALSETCKGRYHACPDRQAVDRHLRQRVDSGLLTLP